MTSNAKRRIKRFLIATEMWWYLITGLLWVFTIAAVAILAPNVSNMTILIVQLISGLTATVAAAISALKADDTEK